MIISSLVYYLRPVAQAGAILLYVELHKGPEPLGKEIAEYVFCVSALERRMLWCIRRDGEDSWGWCREGKRCSFICSVGSFKVQSISVFKELGVIPVLVELSQNTDGDHREKPSRATTWLNYYAANRDTILLAGAIPVLIDLLSGELDEVRDYSAECLINFAEDPLYRVQVS